MILKRLGENSFSPQRPIQEKKDMVLGKAREEEEEDEKFLWHTSQKFVILHFKIRR